MPSVSIVIAAYNEAETLSRVFHRCLAVLQECADDFEIIILNDGSTDQTGEIMEELRAQYPQFVKTITHEVNRGIQDTFEALYRAASKDFVFDVPADGEFPPEALREILPLTPEYDIIVCHRTMKHYNFYRRIISSSYRWCTRIMFGIDLFDPGSVKCRRKEVISDIKVTSKGVFREAERLIRAVRRGYRLGKVDIAHERRLAGAASGGSLGNVFWAASDLVVFWIRLRVLRQRP